MATKVQVELAHEELIRSWPKLRDWIHTAGHNLHLQRRYEQAASAWKQAEEDDSALLTGKLLVEAERWLDETKPAPDSPERLFIEASRRLRERNEARISREKAALERAQQEGIRARQEAAEAALAAAAADRSRARRTLYLSGVSLAALLLAGFFLARFYFSTVERRAVADALAARSLVDTNAAGALELALAATERKRNASTIGALHFVYQRAGVPAISVPYNPKVAWSADGSRLASISSTTARIVSAPKYECLAVLAAGGESTCSPPSPLQAVDIAFGRERRLAAAELSGQVSLWTGNDFQRERILAPNPPATTPAESVAVSEDGALVAVGFGQSGAAVWEWVSGRSIARLDGQAYGLAFYGSLLAIGSENHIEFWRADEPTPASIRLEGPISSLAFSPSGSSLAAVASQRAYVCDVDAGTCAPLAPEITDAESVAALAKDGQWAVVSRNGGARLMLGGDEPVQLDADVGLAAYRSVAFTSGADGIPKIAVGTGRGVRVYPLEPADLIDAARCRLKALRLESTEGCRMQ